MISALEETEVVPAKSNRIAHHRHLKQDFRLSRNWLRGSLGDEQSVNVSLCLKSSKTHENAFLSLIFIAFRAAIAALKNRVYKYG